MLIKFPTPLRFLIYGNSGGGKSFLCSKIIKTRHQCMSPTIDKVLYFANFKTSVPEDIRNDVVFVKGIPQEEHLENPSGEPVLYILDDIQNASFNSDLVAKLFQQSRHRGISIIILVQNLFSSGRMQRDCSLNVTGIFLLATFRDLTPIRTLSYQLDVLHPTRLCEIYFNFVTKAFDYVFIDLHVKTPQILRYRTNLWNENFVEIFVDENQINNELKYEDEEEKDNTQNKTNRKVQILEFPI